LNPETKKRFAPHPFDHQSILQLHASSAVYKLFLATLASNNEVIAYFIIRYGWLEYEAPRLGSYGLSEETRDITLAPSVADTWQGKGIGTGMFRFLLQQLSSRNPIRIMLWGGVQSSNLRALSFYSKLGFRTLGSFQHQGENLDMILELSAPPAEN
jgi:GNAT superfamily N-acetyltransferase